MPGQIVLSPGPEWRDEAAPALAEMIELPFEIRHDVGDKLRAHDLSLSEGSPRLPIVGRVPEGFELQASERSRKAGRAKGLIEAAVPDYLVRPSSALTINDEVLARAVSGIEAGFLEQLCGSGCTVGIVDSGIDPSCLLSPGSLDPRTLSASDPLGAGGGASDLTGHGSLVAHIINRIAPCARLISVKAFDQSGSLSDVLAALYLAHASGPCDVINLSLSMSCDAQACAVCSAPGEATMSLSQLKFFFDAFRAQASQTLLVAAAGNNSSHIAAPAAFDGVLAVGSCHFGTGEVLSKYKAAPRDRFILAPDGTGKLGEELAARAALRAPDPMFGTSFAAAFATGVAARVVCSMKGGLFFPSRLIGGHRPVAVLAALETMADRSWSGYDPEVHGFGRLRL